MEPWGERSGAPGAPEPDAPPLGLFEEAARAFGAERARAEQDLARLLSLAAALSRATSLDGVTAALLSRVASPLGAEYAGIWVADGDDAVLACAHGSGSDALRTMGRVEIAALAPGGPTLLSGTPLWLSSAEELASAFPALEGVRAATGTQAWVGLPLRLSRRTIGLVGLGFLSPRAFGPEDRALHRAIAHLAAQAVERVRLLELERRGRARAEALARLSDDLAGGATLDRAAGDALGRWTASLGGAEAVLWLADGGRFRCIAETPSRGRLHCHEQPAASPVLARALARATTVVARLRAAQPHEHLYLSSAGLDALIACPLVARGEVRGLLCVGFAADAGDPAPAVPDVETFATHCALALDRAALLERERATRRRVELAHGTASALASARTSREILEIALAQGLAAFGAVEGVVLLAADGALEVVGEVGYPEELLAPWGRIGLDVALPLVDAYRRGEPIWLDGAEEAIARYPLLATVGEDRNGAWAALPLAGADGPLGVIGLGFARPNALDADDRAAAVALARTCGLALDRARATEAERRMRGDAEVARAEAERIGALQEQLLAVVGHDLRQPLSAIVLAARLLADQAPGSEAQRRLLARVTHAADRMADMIRNLLDLSRARQGIAVPVERERIDLGALAARAVEEAGSLHPGRLRLEAAEAVAVSGDRSRLGQVLANLVANALEHGEASAPVRVVVRREADEAVLEVWNGGAVPPHLLPHIFEPFARGGGRRGLGLGLFIVREVVRAHGGTVNLWSSQADGTAVRARFPAAAPG